MAFTLSPPPNEPDVQGVAWKQWFFKIKARLEGILTPENGGTGTSEIPAENELLVGNVTGTYALKTLVAGSNVTITNGVSTITIAALGSGGSSKIYEPVAILGEIVFSINGDVMMAWGGDYAT
jgi:hypothetical protein